MSISRRRFLKGSALVSALAVSGKPFSAAPFLRSGRVSHKYIVLGIDGMDPVFLRRMMDDGEVPAFKKLASMGHFGPLQTTMPPQSPVAWSSFITGTDPGGHGIFDFVHRDAKTFTPYLSTSHSVQSDRALQLGNLNIPLAAGRVDLMRKGTPFWDVLSQADIPTTVFSLPANFPVVPSGNVRALSGMGTPDLLGNYGVYTIISEMPVPGSSEFSGGRVERVTLKDHRATAQLKGPSNPFDAKGAPTQTEIVVRRDPVNRVVMVDLGGKTTILQEGEWSDWVGVSFPMMSFLSSIDGAVRIYAKSVHPHLQLYISPIQIDPMNPSMPICSPAGYSRELAEAVGRFYTQGLPADTKALSEGSLTSEEFFQQAKLVLQENLRCFDHEFSRFNDGCFVFYFSSIDQCGHMLWRLMDPQHPLYQPNASAEIKGAIRYFYREMDKVLARVLERLDSSTTLMVLSDHGFAPFTRELHLNAWLVDNGFMTLTKPEKRGEIDFFKYVDWSSTKAYALGINGIYLNLQGREKLGSVSDAAGARIKKALASKLQDFRDPLTNAAVVSRVFDSETLYRNPDPSICPDLLVGYQRGYRISDGAILGKIPREVIGDRTDLWSADHCFDPALIPGVVLSNKRLQKENPAIWDMSPSILKAFGLETPQSMTGANAFEV